MKIAVVVLAAVATVHSSAIRSGRQGPGWGPSPGWSTTTTTTPGWSTPPPTTAGWSTTTQGWSTPPPTTAGWSTTTQGWSSPPTTAGWSTPPPTTAGWSTTTPGWSTTTSGWSTPGWTHGKVSGWGPTTTPGWAPTTTPGWSPPPTTAGWAPPPPSGWAAPHSTTIDLNAALAAAGSGWAAENHAENVQVTGAGGWGPNAEIVITAGGESNVEQDGAILQVTSQDSQQASALNNVAVSQIAEGLEGETLDALGLDVTNTQSGWAGVSGEGSSAAAADSTVIVSKKQ